MNFPNIREENLVLVMKGVHDASCNYKGFEKRLNFYLNLSFELNRPAEQVVNIFQRIIVEYG